MRKAGRRVAFRRAVLTRMCNALAGLNAPVTPAAGWEPRALRFQYEAPV